MSITASEARKALFPLIKKVNEDHDAIEIVSKHGNAVLVSADDYAALREGAYLLAAGEAGIRGPGLGGLHLLAQDRPQNAGADQQADRGCPARSLHRHRQARAAQVSP